MNDDWQGLMISAFFDFIDQTTVMQIRKNSQTGMIDVGSIGQ
jgi:hypothetical protein